MQELPNVEAASVVTDCRCESSQPRNFVRPCVLLLLAEQPAHGYELLDRLRPFGFDLGDPAGIYRTLRQMETERLVTSQWQNSNRGPSRRIYALTSDGHDLLAAWSKTLDRTRAILGLYLERYKSAPSVLIGRERPIVG